MSDRATNNQDLRDALTGSEDEHQPSVTVERFKALVREDWGLSQFWYSVPFARRLSTYIHSLASEIDPVNPEHCSVAFVSCPTGFAAFSEQYPLHSCELFDYDPRLKLFGDKFVPFDMNDNTFTAKHGDLRHSYRIVVCDPPYINQTTHSLMAKVCNHLLDPTKGSKLLVISGSRLADELSGLYGYNLQTVEGLDPEHDGLRTDFGAWCADSSERFIQQATPQKYAKSTK